VHTTRVRFSGADPGSTSGSHRHLAAGVPELSLYRSISCIFCRSRREGIISTDLRLMRKGLGGLLWLCSFHPYRHRIVLCYLGVAFIIFGVVMWGVDLVERMPAYAASCSDCRPV